MISALAVSSLVPAAVASADDKQTSQYEVAELVFETDGKLAKVDIADYLEEVGFGFKDDAKYVIYPNGEAYAVSDYLEEFGFVGDDLKQVYENLKANGATDEKIYQGYFEDGKIVIKDEQPEDRLNETFFYNVA